MATTLVEYMSSQNKTASSKNSGRLLGVVAFAAVFGVLWAIVKGQGEGWRYVAGNLSAPWLFLPLAAVGVLSARPRLVRAAAAAAVAFVSLVAFYATTSSVWHAVNAHSIANNVFFVVAGTGFCGLLALVASGVVTTVRRAILVGGLFLIVEPIFSFVYGRFFGSYDHSMVPIAIIEFALGVACVLLNWTPAQSRKKTA